MTKRETGFFSSFDGTKLFYRAWENVSNINLIVVHGIGEHSGRYQEFAEQLAELPISVYVADSRGHGRSEGEPVYVDSFNDFINDLYYLRSFIEKKSNISGHFILMGQSLGGLIATMAVLKNQLSWQSLILASPFFAVPEGHQFFTFLSAFINSVLPKLIWNNPIKPAFLSHDPKEIKDYISDPLIQRRITGRLAHEMFQACQYVEKHAAEVTLPVLILAPEQDRIVSLKAVQKFYNAISSKSKRIEVFPNCFHELLHEFERHDAIRMIKEYVLKTGR